MEGSQIVFSFKMCKSQHRFWRLSFDPSVSTIRDLGSFGQSYDRRKDCLMIYLHPQLPVEQAVLDGFGNVFA